MTSSSQDPQDTAAREAALRAAWRDVAPAAAPDGWQSGVMCDLRQRADSSQEAAVVFSVWWGPIAAAALLLLALGVAGALGVSPRSDLIELATQAGTASHDLLSLRLGR